MTDGDVLPYVQERLPHFSAAGEATRLPDGNLNFVWRVPGGLESSVIVKHAPPYIAANPDVPLDPSRLLIEAQCLDVFGRDGRLSDIPEAEVRAPRLVDVNEAKSILIMEDLGDLPTLDRWLRTTDPTVVEETVPVLGARLGSFIGQLHARTCDVEVYEEAFDNQAMQETRYTVQYQGVTTMLSQGGVPDAEALGARAEALGRALKGPGQCLTMGDLWPRSILINGEELRLIDWELAHYGRPLQDVAHWRAHLWMQAHRAPSGAVRSAVDVIQTSFFEAYLDALGEKKRDLWTKEETRDAALHFGAEILVRAVGPFQDGYVYAGLDPDHSAVQEAVAVAANALRDPAGWGVFG